VNEIRTVAEARPGGRRHDYGCVVRRGLALLSTMLVACLLVASVDAGTSRPPVAGPTLGGDRLSLSDLRGKPVVINVWSSW
jgi:hypothetical protein